MPSVTVTKITPLQDGRVIVRFGKREREFASVADMREFARSQVDAATLEGMAVGLMLTRQPALGNPGVFEGRSVNVDFSLANWGTIT